MSISKAIGFRQSLLGGGARSAIVIPQRGSAFAEGGPEGEEVEGEKKILLSSKRVFLKILVSFFSALQPQLSPLIPKFRAPVRLWRDSLAVIRKAL
jgi:hypothetical protein